MLEYTITYDVGIPGDKTYVFNLVRTTYIQE